MTEFTMEMAGCTVGVSAIHERTRDFCREYLSQGEPELRVEITPGDLEAERALSEVQNPSDAQLESTALQRKLAERLFERDVLLFHGSAVAVNGECYIFTALSGTGKSTHTRLWRELLGERAVMVNDDKPFLRFTPRGVTVCGSPWNGKHHLGANMQVPLKAICILERGEENSIRAITAREALPTILQQSHRPADRRNMMKYLELLDRLSNAAAFYRLQCNMAPQAAQVAYEAMRD